MKTTNATDRKNGSAESRICIIYLLSLFVYYYLIFFYKFQVLTALKAFGNLGHFGERANDLLDCALTATNKMTLRLAAIDAFRRSPCKEEVRISYKNLLNFYSN